MIGAMDAAFADDHGFYTAVEGGMGTYRNDDVDLSRSIFKGEDKDNTSFAWAFAAGYRFNRFLAVELGFSDLGRVTTTLIPRSDDSIAGEIRSSARGKTLALLVHAPTGNWDPYFKLGAIKAITDLRVDAPLVDQGLPSSVHDEQPRVLLGVGARYAFTEQWAVSFAFDYYVNLGARGDIESKNVASPRFGFAYRF
jgi:opacity protein-like surface antigen